MSSINLFNSVKLYIRIYTDNTERSLRKQERVTTIPKGSRLQV